MKFLESNFYVTRPLLAIHVPFGTSESVHRNRPSHGIAFFADGEYRYTFRNGQVITCQKGDIIYLPQYSDYTVSEEAHTPNAAKSVFAINFLISSDERFDPFKIRAKNPAKIQVCFETAERQWVKKGVGFTESVFSDLYRILSIMKQDCRSGYYDSNHKEMISPAIRYIRDHYTSEKICVEKLAAECGISVSYLRRLFCDCCGVSPIEYVVNLRLEYAKELILSKEFSVTATAEKAGFHDVSYFSRVFKKHFGVSPVNAVKSNEILWAARG